MDVESNTSQEGDAKNNEDVPQMSSPNLETNGSLKESPKHNSRQKRGQPRSRSRTPQKKTEDSKTLHVTLKKLESELNGKDVQEETGNTEERENGSKVENGNKVGSEEKDEEKSVNEDTSNAKESNKGKQTHTPKDEKSKKDEKKKLNTQEKKESTKKTDLPKKESPKKDKRGKGKTEANELESETVEMDPLVISDEPDPELQFDENSDVESGKGSPVIPRCLTRRSQTRNIPTPKTPKLVDPDVDSEKNSAVHTPTGDVDNDTDLPKTDHLNDSCDSIDTVNLSTKAEVGSDATRMDYIDHYNSNLEDSSYINASREKSLSETLRGLSARRSIRPLDDFRRRVLRSNQEKSDLNVPYPSRHSVDSITTGVKRKSRSITPEDRKRFRTESPGLNSVFSSPFANIRNKFKSDLPSSTPKLLSYRDNRSQLHYHDDDNFENGDDEKKSWCSIM